MKRIVPKATLRKRRRRRWLTLILFLVLLAGALIAARFIPFTVTKVEGTVLTESWRIPEKLFPEEKRTLIDLFYNIVRGKKVPGIASWHVTFEDFTSYSLTVEEEEAAAQIRSEGRFLVLSGSGAVLTVRDEADEALTPVSGCGIAGGEPLTIPEVQDRKAFEGLLKYAESIRRSGLSGCSLTVANGEYHLRIGEIDVELGSAEHAEDKIRIVRDQSSYYEGLSGTLHLENYRPDALNEKYVFEVKTEEAN